MKNLLVLFLIVVCSSCVFSTRNLNTDGYMEFYNSHKGGEGVVSFSIPAGLVGFVVRHNAEEDVDELVNKMQRVNFFIADDADKELVKDLKKSLSESKYKDIMQVKDGRSNVVFKIRESEENCDELLMMVQDEEDVFVMCICGGFTVYDAKKLAKSINIKEAVKTRE